MTGCRPRNRFGAILANLSAAFLENSNSVTQRATVLLQRKARFGLPVRLLQCTDSAGASLLPRPANSLRRRQA
jgi:hypothetical protein